MFLTILSDYVVDTSEIAILELIFMFVVQKLKMRISLYASSATFYK